MTLYVWIFFTGFFCTLLLTPVVRKAAYLVRALDFPSSRKVHTTMMPRLGGLALFAAYLTTVLLFIDLTPQAQGLLLGSTIILIVGVIDDIKGIPARAKFLGQVLAALVVTYFGVRITILNNPFDGIIQLGFMTVPITVLWIVGITNAVNLIDGLDGLASGVSAISLTAFSLISFSIGQETVSLMAFALAACLFAFLYFNFFPAKIFLGDSGSLFLGFSISTLAVYGLLKSVTVIAFVVPVIILGVPIFDTAYAIFRRFRQNTPIFQADKKHIHHRLLSFGFTHKQAVMIIYLISIVFSASAIWVTVRYRPF